MDTFRYSALDTAHRCLQRYKLQYLDKVEVPGLPSIDLEFGTAMHAGINACLEGEDPEAVFHLYWDSLKDTKFMSSQADWKELKSKGEILLTRFKRLHAKHFAPVSMETKLVGEIGGYAVEGTPDFIGAYKGVPSIVDFKTAGYEYPKERIIVNEQMPIYAHLATQQLGYAPEQLVYYVFIKREERIQVITRPLTKELLDNAINNVILMCEDLKKREKFPRNPSSCMMGKFKCPYFERCHGKS